MRSTIVRRASRSRCAAAVLAATAALALFAVQPALACGSTPESTIETGNIGIRMTRRACAAENAEECYRSAKVTLTIIRKNRACPGVDRSWVDSTSAQLRSIMRGLETADPRLKGRIAREEAQQRAADHAAAEALRGSGVDQGRQSTCMSRVYAGCAAQCGGQLNCNSACVGASSWQCYR